MPRETSSAMRKPISVAIALLLTLVVPFLLRPDDQTFSGKPDGKVVIVTPHHTAICTEFGQAFSRYMKKETGKTIAVDWRIPGGTTEIKTILDSDFRAAFEQHWKRTGKRWNDQIGDAFSNRRLKLPADPTKRTLAQEARAAFLGSDIGVGIDLFFGGGAYDFRVAAEQGFLVSHDTSDVSHGPASLAENHPDWFSDDVIPASVSGERYYDPEFRWIGTCLSSFGIVFNKDSFAKLGLRKYPEKWDDLGSPLLNDQIAIADPTKSGSVTKAFEMLIQEKIQKALAGIEPDPELTRAQLEDRALRSGWEQGLKLIQRISGNARYFTDDATKIPRDVASGVAAAGMCIDFYGRTQSEAVLKKDGTSRVTFITPVGGSSTSVDPIGMFRGAPNPELAHAFLEFVLSPDGQKLWDFRPGTPGGPVKHALRRLPIRKDLYTAEHLTHFSDPEVMPFESAGAFIYQPAYTARTFNALRLIVRVMCLDTHKELRAAWAELIRAGYPDRATRTFQNVQLVNYDAALGRIDSVIRSGDKLLEVRLSRDLADYFRRNYQTAAAMAQRGE